MAAHFTLMEIRFLWKELIERNTFLPKVICDLKGYGLDLELGNLLVPRAIPSWKSQL